MLPTSDEQIRFLVQIQRLLDEGLFVATYKFAPLQSLADIAIEQGDDSEAPLTISTNAIAEKFIRYYWRPAMPYPAAVVRTSWYIVIVRSDLAWATSSVGRAFPGGNPPVVH